MDFKTFFHYFIILNLVTGYLSALYMVFIVYKVKGKSIAPLWKNAPDVPQDFFMRRRLYAIESWIIFGILAIYFILSNPS